MPTYYRAHFSSENVVGPWQTEEELLEEIRDFVCNMGDMPKLVVRVYMAEMSETEFNKMPEFKGY